MLFLYFSQREKKSKRKQVGLTSAEPVEVYDVYTNLLVSWKVFKTQSFESIHIHTYILFVGSSKISKRRDI